MQNQRDQNIVNAWQKGGLFEGKPVTDEIILKYWKVKADSVDKKDPLYDTYHNAHDQFDYSIHESKISTLYKQGKIGEGAVAAFYLNWAKKVPKNSEFYRTLQRDAAQFMKVAGARGRASSGRRREGSHQKQQADIHTNSMATGEYVIDTLRAIAQRGNVEAGIAPLIGGPGTNSNNNLGRTGADLTDFDSSDPEQMIRLIEIINKSGNKVLYHTEDGRPVTAAQILASVKKLDPKFNGTFNLSYVQQVLKNHVAGLDKAIDLASSTGHKTLTKSLKNAKRYVALIGSQVRAWPVETDYMILRKTYQDAINDPAAQAADKVAAWKEYQSGLLKLVDDPRIAADDNFRSRLSSEANMQEGAPTIAESFTGLGIADPDKVSDIADNKFHIEALQNQIEAVANGQAVWTTGVTAKDGTFTPQAGGPVIAAATVDDIHNASPVEPKIMYIPNLSGNATPVAVIGAQVKAVAHYANGDPVASSNSNPVASVYRVNINGLTTDVFGFEVHDAKGGTSIMYSTEPPWDQSKIAARQTTSGITLDLSAFVPVKDENGQFGTPGAGFALVSNDAGTRSELQFDPAGVALTSDVEKNALGGYDPMTDFFSPTIAALMSTEEGRINLDHLSTDHNFMAQMDAEAHVAAGFTLDPNAPGGWSGGNADKYTDFSNQAVSAANVNKIAGGIESFITNAAAFLQRSSTDNTFHGPTQDERRGYGFKPLPSEELRALDHADILGNLFIPGTNNIKPPDLETTAMGIAVKGQIVVPFAPDVRLSPYTPAPATAPTYAPAPQLGTVARRPTPTAPTYAPAPQLGTVARRPAPKPPTTTTTAPTPSYNPSRQL